MSDEYRCKPESKYELGPLVKSKNPKLDYSQYLNLHSKQFMSNDERDFYRLVTMKLQEARWKVLPLKQCLPCHLCTIQASAFHVGG